MFGSGDSACRSSGLDDLAELSVGVDVAFLCCWVLPPSWRMRTALLPNRLKVSMNCLQSK